MAIICNNQARPVLKAWDLTKKERAEFDYMDDEAIQWASFMRYKGEVYDLGEFQVLPKQSAEYIGEGAEKFHGWQYDSAFTGILVRYSNDFESVVVGRYYV